MSLGEFIFTFTQCVAIVDAVSNYVDIVSDSISYDWIQFSDHGNGFKVSRKGFRIILSVDLINITDLSFGIL